MLKWDGIRTMPIYEFKDSEVLEERKKRRKRRTPSYMATAGNRQQIADTRHDARTALELHMTARATTESNESNESNGIQRIQRDPTESNGIRQNQPNLHMRC